jgi:hypothetical protein
MNVTASKLLLCVAIGAYTFRAWDRLFPPDKPAAVANKGKELTAGMVNHSIALALGGDPFGSAPFNLGKANDRKKPQLSTGVLDDGPGKPLPQLALQGILLTPTGPVALINGKPLEEGEVATVEEGKARIRARRIGEDFAVIEGAAQIVVLKLDEQNKNQMAGVSPVAPARMQPNYPSMRRLASGSD